jgi:phosphate transport system substrate-binding protein
MTSRLAATRAALILIVFANTSPTFAEELVITGSGNPEYVLGQLARAFNQRYPNHRVVIPTSNGTGGAIRDVMEGRSLLSRVGRPLREDEKAKGLTYIPMGRDAVVFTTGEGVSVNAISFEQALGIYEGRYTNWKELGGRPGPIRAIGRESTDASRATIAATDKRFVALKFADSVKVVHLDPQMIELLDRYPTSFGFLNQSALLAAKTRLRRLTLESVEPSNVNNAAGRYPMLLEFGFIHRTGALREPASTFLAFVASPEGATILQQHGVIPILR